MASIPLVRVMRSGLEESVHEGDIAVVDPDGRLLARAGDPDRMLYARSSMKPLQAAVSLSLGAPGGSDREVAVMCASHNGEPVHVDAVRSLLSGGGVEEAELLCPPMRPWDEESALAAGERKRIYSDCSGKHAGMLAACVARGWPGESYREPDHPLQREVLRAVAAAADVEDVRVGVDGCGVPVHALPLRSMATIYARLASPDRLPGLEPHARRAAEAMLSEPYMVAGRNRVDTALMEVASRVVVKAGAEGLICAAVIDRGIGMAVRIRDGSPRAPGPALIRALELLEVLDSGQVERLAPFARPPVLGGGEPVGEIEARFELTTL